VKKTLSLFLIGSLASLCVGLAAFITLQAPERERHSRFVACFSGETPLYVGEIRGLPSSSDGEMSFFSIEHGSVVTVVGAACVVMQGPP
jgi:hypothetical protein